MNLPIGFYLLGLILGSILIASGMHGGRWHTIAIGFMVFGMSIVGLIVRGI